MNWPRSSGSSTTRSVLITVASIWCVARRSIRPRSTSISSHSPLLLVTLLWTAPGTVVLLTLSILQAEDRLFRFATVSILSTVGSQVFGIVLLFLFTWLASVTVWRVARIDERWSQHLN